MNVEKYLTLNLPLYHGRSLARFRCSNHKLNTEYGRHFNVNREDRVWTYCFLHTVILVSDDEYHAFYICGKFETIRETYLSPWLAMQPSRENLALLFEHENPSVIKQNSFLCVKTYEEHLILTHHFVLIC